MLKIWKGAPRGGGERGINTNHPAVQLGQDFVSICWETLDLDSKALKA